MQENTRNTTGKSQEAPGAFSIGDGDGDLELWLTEEILDARAGDVARTEDKHADGRGGRHGGGPRAVRCSLDGCGV